jgi:hypothetical protein
MPPQSFMATLERPDSVGAWTYLTVPFDAAAVFGAKGQIKIKGTLNGARFRGLLMPHGDGRHFLVVNKALRDKAQAEAGSTVQVGLELDTSPRRVNVPRDIKQALAANPAAAAAFNGLAPSHQQEYVDHIAEAKKDETRRRRIVAAITRLSAAKPA